MGDNLGRRAEALNVLLIQLMTTLTSSDEMNCDYCCRYCITWTTFEKKRIFKLWVSSKVNIYTVAEVNSHTNFLRLNVL